MGSCAASVDNLKAEEMRSRDQNKPIIDTEHAVKIHGNLLTNTDLFFAHNVLTSETLPSFLSYQ
jgi:hypothetical protein